MKTAMQELIEWYTLRRSVAKQSEIILKAKLLLEKERQQIIKAHLEGMVDKQPDTFIGKERTSEQYYNETYNQK